MRAVQSRHPAYALPSLREAKHTSHIVVVGQGVGCQQTKIPMGRNVFIVHHFSFSAFPMDFLFTPHMAVAERLNTTIAEFAFIIGKDSPCHEGNGEGSSLRNTFQTHLPQR
ncbi:uncharacterized protein TM35_000281860 [Trypanosoma theileri]|uniref:Uncharacterized protein n=1 Tax=Trypanosoma theileri TaxID=67003 RepID=A0A1X0NQS3_9TRYP|nr:uncharacterized protein TM35_000281860 [Trypanosoma theileri]ORC86470.1 hypothetical protein TM35_000281860 [Trypanosoma theileri]